MAAPLGSPINVGKRNAQPRRQPTRGLLAGTNVWDDCIKLSDQVGFTWFTGALVADDAANDAAKTANDTAIAAGIAAAVAARKPLYIGNLGAKGRFLHSAYIEFPDGLEVRADGPRMTQGFGEPLSTASAGEKQSPTCNLRVSSSNKLWGFTHQILGATVRTGFTTNQHIARVDNGSFGKNIQIDGIQIVGGASAGFSMFLVENVRSSSTEVSATMADAFITSRRANTIDINNHTALNTGDDGLSFVGLDGVSTNPNAGYVENVRFAYINARNSQACGLRIAGAKNIHGRWVKVRNSAKQGIISSRDAGYFTPPNKNWSVCDATVLGTGSSTWPLFEVGGTDGVNGFVSADTGTKETRATDNGFILNFKGRAGVGNPRGLLVGAFVSNLYANIDVGGACLYGFSLGTSQNNIEINGRIDGTLASAGVISGGSFTGTEPSFAGGYCIIGPLTINACCYAALDDILNFQGTGVEGTTPQMNAFSQVEFNQIIHTLGVRPDTGAAVTNATIDFQIDVVQTSLARTLRRVGFSTNVTGRFNRNTGWTVVTA